MALWFAAHEPTWFSPLAGWLTKRTEFVLPLLLLWPSYPTQTRSLAFLLAVLLHSGIALCLTLGPFSYAMICLVWLAVPGAALDALAHRAPRQKFLRWARYRAKSVRALRRIFGSSRPRAALPLAFREWAVRLREGTLAFMLLVESVSLLTSNRAIPKGFRPE